MRAWRRSCLFLSGAATAAVAALAPMSAAGRTEDGEAANSLAGSYLAGRFARGQHETGSAADFYRNALLRDPGSAVLLEQAFMMEAAEGRWPRATELAQELAGTQTTNRMARVFLGLTEFKAANFAKADEHLAAAASSPISELTSVLTRAWIKLAAGDPQGALDLLEVPKQADWAQEYVRFHRALLANAAGRPSEARLAFERVLRQGNRSLRTTIAYAQHAANGGDVKLARTVLKSYIERSQGEPHPLVAALDARLEAGERPGLLVTGAADGLAEVFYGLGEALTGEGGISVGVLYLQMALYVKPDHPFALVALAQAHEAAKKYAEANEVYDRVPGTSALTSGIAIQKAFNLSSQEKIEEAQAVLEQEAAAHPADIRPLDALGNIMRTRKRYAEAAEYYTRAITLIPKPDKNHWAYFYARGTCHERLKNWPLAEADLQKALRLYPDQPLVLNYLGYSWVDQNKNMKQGMGLIEKAVALKPDDGYIVDSLGWAHYKLGNYKEAVRHLERAVELRPDDPVLNDHLGDALWRAGREREARFQWDQALILKPEPDEIEKIKRKLADGLAAEAKPVVRKQVKQAKSGSLAKRRETKLAPPRPLLD